MRFRGPRSEPLPEIYFPHAQRSYLILNVVLKSAGDPRALIPAVRAVLKEVDPQKPAHGLYPLEDLIGATYARDRQAMVALLVFAGTRSSSRCSASTASSSQRVRERSREIGIRMAMGADRSRLVGWVAEGGPAADRVGVAAGLLAAWTLAGTIEGLAVRRGADRCDDRRRRRCRPGRRRDGGDADPVLASDADRSGRDPPAGVRTHSTRSAFQN